MTETTQAKKLKVSCSIPGGIELQITREAGSTAFPGTRVTVPYGNPVAIPGGGTSHALVDAKFMEAWFSQNKNNEALKRCILVEDPDAPAPTDNVEKSDDGAGDEAATITTTAARSKPATTAEPDKRARTSTPTRAAELPKS